MRIDAGSIIFVSIVYTYTYIYIYVYIHDFYAPDDKYSFVATRALLFVQ